MPTYLEVHLHWKSHSTKASMSLLLIKVSQNTEARMLCDFKRTSEKVDHLFIPTGALWHRNPQVNMKNQILKY